MPGALLSHLHLRSFRPHGHRSRPVVPLATWYRTGDLPRAPASGPTNPGTRLSAVPCARSPRAQAQARRPYSRSPGNWNKIKSFSVQNRHTARSHCGVIKVTASNLLNRKCAAEGGEVSACPWPVRGSGSSVSEAEHCLGGRQARLLKVPSSTQVPEIHVYWVRSKPCLPDTEGRQTGQPSTATHAGLP